MHRILFQAFVVWALGACTTIKPTVTQDLITSCTSLCKKKTGLESITTNIELNYYGKMKLLSNTCTCKEGSIIEIIPPGESIF